MWLGISWFEEDRLFERLNRGLVFALHVQDASELVVRLGKAGIVSERLTEILLGFDQLN